MTSDRDNSRRLYEERGMVLDFVEGWAPRRVSIRQESTPYIQLIGNSYFTLLEATGIKDAKLNPLDIVFIGSWPRKQINTILGRITWNDLTPEAKDNLPRVVREIVTIDSLRFVNTINQVQLLTPRMHTLELLPGVGKVLVRRILDQRSKAPFNSIDDLRQRTGLQDPIRMITERIIQELTGDEKYKIFVRQ